jgi:hypothetical protein
MRLDFERMQVGPNRDASWYFAVDVYDDAGTRYPVRIMTEGIELARFNQHLNAPEDGEEVVTALYRRELERLVREGALRPQGNGTVNVVFLANGNSQVQPGDIVIYDAYGKLRAMAQQLGRLP